MRKRAAPRIYIAVRKRCVPGNASHVKAVANTCTAVRARAGGAGPCENERLRAFILQYASGACLAMCRVSKRRQIHVQLSRRERSARGYAQMSGSALLYCSTQAVRARQCAARQSSGKYMCSCPGASGRRGAMRKRPAPRFYIAVSKQRVPGNAAHVKAEMR